MQRRRRTTGKPSATLLNDETFGTAFLLRRRETTDRARLVALSQPNMQGWPRG